MDEDDDDLYGGGSIEQQNQQQVKEEDEDEQQKMEVSEEEEDDDDSDDDVQITIDKPEGAKASEPPAKQQKTKHDRTLSESKPAKASTSIKTEPSTSSAAQPTAAKTVLTHNCKEGKDFPEYRVKNSIDVNAIPTWTNGKPLTAVDIDADLTENSKPWRLPGCDTTDFFNYGFDEYTWASYCVKQQIMGTQIGQIKQEDAQMKMFMGIGDGDNKQGGGGGPGSMPPMPPGMDMNDPNAMAQMFGGMDPSQFMQNMGMFGGGLPGMGGMPGGQGGGQQFQQGGQGGFGGGQNTASPNPQPGQGFQAPQGPNAAGEGYSQQQLDMMNMGGGGGSGGGRGRNRRGGGRGGW